jgi:Protein of unknown function (DUF1302)
MRKVHSGRRLAGVAVAACLGLGGWQGAHGFGFKSDSGDWAGNWDTTVGYGQGWRLSGLDCRLIAIANGGCGYSPNIDDGDLNYPAKATYTQAATFVTEFALHYKDTVGVFVRASGLYDFEVMGNTTPWVPLSSFAKDTVGRYVRLLDGFAYLRFNLGSMASELRLGRQVVDWGESTYIAGGLNAVNYFDVTALQVPGSELKQALLPDTMAVFNIQLTKNLSSQLLYLFDWHKDILEPDGAYFSTNDFAGPGGNKVVLGFGAISDHGVDFTSLGGTLISDFQAIPRLPDHTPPQAGQFGINFKLYLPDFAQGTQLGFYFLNYTSRLPVVSANTGTQAGMANAIGAATATGLSAQLLAGGASFNQAVGQATIAGQQAAAAQGGNLSQATAHQYATIGANTLLAGGNVQGQAVNLATNEYAHTQGLFLSYPNDIKLLGLSFNSQVQKTGTALQGEVAYRHDVPLQTDDVELIYASLTPFESGLTKALAPTTPISAPGHCTAGSATPITGCNQLGAFALGQTIPGYQLKDTWHFDLTATQVFANVLKASQAVLLVEAGADFVPGLEDRNSGGPVGLGLRYDGPGTNLSGNPGLGGYPQYPAVNGQCVATGYPNPLGQCIEPGSAFATRFAWGYVIYGKLEYDNVIGAWNLTPHALWSQDVNGVSPGPGGSFVSGRYASTVGVTASTRQRLDLDVSYSHFGGAGQYNLLHDRDFIAASIKFSF